MSSCDVDIWKNLSCHVADSILKLVWGHVPDSGAIPKAPHPSDAPRIILRLASGQRVSKLKILNNNALRVVSNP